MRSVSAAGRVGKRRVGQKVGDDFHVAREPELLMLAAAELALGDERIDVGELPLQVARVAPELGRSPVMKHAA